MPTLLTFLLFSSKLAFFANCNLKRRRAADAVVGKHFLHHAAVHPLALHQIVVAVALDFLVANEGHGRVRHYKNKNATGRRKF